ncbi:MAG TPA: hypothetical protein VHV08_10395, partial [Pirellulales bacterium]|nr:hypothetical protein [Pirellulales bacterium]
MQSPGKSVLRLALLGIDPDALQVARAAIDNRSFQLIAASEADGAATAPGARLDLSFLGRIRQLDSWEALLDQEFVDAVYVAYSADEDRRADQLRKLIQVGMPVLVSHPAVDSMLVYYELDMIRRETGSVVLPYLPARHHPALCELNAAAVPGAASSLGRVEQVILARSLVEPAKASVARQFARDVDLIRSIAGDMTMLAAIGGGSHAARYTNVAIQMSGPQDIVARWSVLPDRVS